MKKLVLLFLALLLAVTPVSASGLTVGSWNGWPTLEKSLTKDVSGQLGLGYSSAAGAGTLWYLIKLDLLQEKIEKIQPAFGVYYNSSTAAGAAATFGLTWGIMAPIWKTFSVGFDVILLNNVAGTTWLLPSTVFKATYVL